MEKRQEMMYSLSFSGHANEVTEIGKVEVTAKDTEMLRQTEVDTYSQTEEERHKCPTVTSAVCKSCREGDYEQVKGIKH